jgi:hypothetical protein
MEQQLNIIETIQEYSKQEYKDKLDVEKIKFPHSPLELYNNLITFLSIPRVENDVVCIRTRSGTMCHVELDVHSGSIFSSIYGIESIKIYIGVGEFIQHGTQVYYPAFLVKGDSGISYWDNIRSFDEAVNAGTLYNISDKDSTPITLLQNVRSRPKILNFTDVMMKHREAADRASDILSSSMDILCDAVIQCNDGDVKIVRYMLAKNSEFFLHMFRYSPECRVFKLNFDKFVLEVYINYNYLMNLFCVKQTLLDKICEEASTMIEFGVFIQDLHFVKEVYTIVSNECDEETLEKLNGHVKQLISFE